MICLTDFLQIWPPAWLLLVLVLFLLHRYGSCRFGVWEGLGVPGPKPWPFIGTAYSMITQGLRKHDQRCIAKYGRLIGLYEGKAPVLLVADPDLLKQILVKDFSSFTDRCARPLFTGKEHYVFRLTINRLMGDHWRSVRSTLTPAFSTGKLKMMFCDMKECAKLLMEKLTNLASIEEDIDIKQYTGAFSMDVIARTAFGLQTNSQDEPDGQFMHYAKQLFTPGVVNARSLFILFFPFLARKLGLRMKLYSPEILEFFIKITQDAIRERGINSELRTDFLQLLMDHSKDNHEGRKYDSTNFQNINNNTMEYGLNRKSSLCEEEVLAQSFALFAAGYETTASTLTFLAYNLATHPTVQSKLVQEIDAILDGEEISYESVQQMTYLEACIHETLRLYPTATRIMRACTQDVTLGTLPIKRGCLIGIPIYSMHHDPEYWSDPETFDPDRFSLENKGNIKAYTYLPFGLGPRSCIGMRFAMLEIKIAMANILSMMTFHMSNQTQVPLTFKKNVILIPEKPVKMRIKMRKREKLE